MNVSELNKYAWRAECQGFKSSHPIEIILFKDIFDNAVDEAQHHHLVATLLA